jgi:NAD(P)-dependent dehydrogenase (short-subunit alcohol dehydrogenase family)
MTLAGKRVLITGGARGLGRAFAEAAIGAGARVTIADVLRSGKQTAKDIGADFHWVDLSSKKSIETCAQKLNRLDGLVNNAAITSSGGRKMEELDAATWDKVMAVNVRGAWLLTRAVLPLLRKSACGRIVNIASDTAAWGAPRLLAYIASKGALIAMTRGMARELGPDGITVNAVAPGLTLDEATEYVPAERHRQYVEGRAIQRAQLPGDICGALLFLLSDDAAFVTGQVLPVNGGFVMN